MKRGAKFLKFIDTYGARKLAEDLALEPRTVRWWKQGTIPRLGQARRLVELSRKFEAPLTLEDIRPGQPAVLKKEQARRPAEASAPPSSEPTPVA